MKIQNLQQNSLRTNFTGVSINKNAKLLLQETPIKNFLRDKKTQNLISLLEKEHNTDCLLVPRETDCLVQLGKQENDNFKLYYVTTTIKNFVKDSKAIIAKLTNPEYMAEQQARAQMRDYARQTNRTIVALPNFLFNK